MMRDSVVGWRAACRGVGGTHPPGFPPGETGKGGIVKCLAAAGFSYRFRRFSTLRPVWLHLMELLFVRIEPAQ